MIVARDHVNGDVTPHPTDHEHTSRQQRHEPRLSPPPPEELAHDSCSLVCRGFLDFLPQEGRRASGRPDSCLNPNLSTFQREMQLSGGGELLLSVMNALR